MVITMGTNSGKKKVRLSIAKIAALTFIVFAALLALNLNIL